MKSKKYKILKWTLGTLASIIILLICLGFWIKSLVPPRQIEMESSKTDDLAYVTRNIPEPRGKILAVVTSTSTMGTSGKSTGYELTELARAYYVFTANGFEVDIASPLGGKPPVVIDDEDMGEYDYAFLNDSEAQHKANNTIKIDNVITTDYEAVYFVGGKGAMFDFPNNAAIQAIIKEYYQERKVIGAVCHGPAALVNVTLDNGQYLVENKTVSSFTNKEELLLISDAETIFPFLLQDKLIEGGARFNEGSMYLEKMSHDDHLITGQNPWSVWVLAETMIKQLGYTPKTRPITGEENAVSVLLTYEREGIDKAKALMEHIMHEKKEPMSRLLVTKHSIIGVMKGDVKRFTNILRLASYAKKLDSRE
ncbi:type 1 glutamine amidotransferase domain-containing protein [Psychroserpens luteolus]|uniref:type 1 glutamine amidotransferase domain-containing protein n=1 Tax=Psychroserpens luteolus TaxID=2855840 RepID=UPI001E3B59A4|nr:type 1 glutamine amidotransferase domain-containing protein [Psychroserpens luteolus]MCD2258829.1 type 1 glutamine amidotransferase domain-containing protein [Psychroserpens luteolus]